MAAPLLPAVEIGTAGAADATIIWLHGLGADGHDFEPIVPELDLTGVRFVFPHAPYRPVTINGGYGMRAWYDVRSFDTSQGEDEQGIREAARTVCTFLEAERETGLDASKIVLAGFSQGGAIALHTGLRYPERLAGILALSAYLPLAHTVAAEARRANADTPVFMGHGNIDEIIPLGCGEGARDHLRALGHPVEWHAYTMGHSVCIEEVRDIGSWLSQTLRT